MGRAMGARPRKVDGSNHRAFSRNREIHIGGEQAEILQGGHVPTRGCHGAQVKILKRLVWFFQILYW